MIAKTIPETTSGDTERTIVILTQYGVCSSGGKSFIADQAVSAIITNKKTNRSTIAVILHILSMSFIINNFEIK